ncbi:MAG: AbrB/MazE/SpoVT family DNA-binding domain-containing protein [Gammaproteobacteria bacterium]
METKITQWGNSLGVRVPAALAAEVGLKAGTEVNLIAEGRSIKLVPLGTPRRYSLKELLAGITKDNLQPVFPTGPDVGREVIE